MSILGPAIWHRVNKNKLRQLYLTLASLETVVLQLVTTQPWLSALPVAQGTCNDHLCFCLYRNLCYAVPYVLHCTALYSTALHCTALHCSVLHCAVLHCIVLCCALLCSALLCTLSDCFLFVCLFVCLFCFFGCHLGFCSVASLGQHPQI